MLGSDKTKNYSTLLKYYPWSKRIFFAAPRLHASSVRRLYRPTRIAQNLSLR